MSQALQIPDEVYQAIQEYAAIRGQTPEEAVAAWVSSLTPQADANSPDADRLIDDPNHDPWPGFRGTATALSPDSIDRHDAYLAEE